MKLLLLLVQLCQILNWTAAIPATIDACSHNYADVIFLVDASYSIGEQDFQKVKGFIKDVVQVFDIGPNNTEVALIEYSSYANIEIKLDDHSDVTGLTTAIDNVTYSGGATLTSDAIVMMRQQGFEGERTDAPDVAILITDGQSKYPSVTRMQATLAKKEEITIIAIGIGNETDISELINIASSAQDVFQVPDFDTFRTLYNDVAERVCSVVLPAQHYIRTSPPPPKPTPEGCADLTRNCTLYPRDACSDYPVFTNKYCRQTCGHCGGSSTVDNTCVDKDNDCSSYGTSMCFDEKQYDFVDNHCRKFCGFCGKKSDILIPGPVQTAPPTTVGPCIDAVGNCDPYGGKAMCSDISYSDWARKNCAKYCGYCFIFTEISSKIVNGIMCPPWQLPSQCTLQYSSSDQCCPMPVCPDDFRIIVKRHL